MFNVFHVEIENECNNKIMFTMHNTNNKYYKY